VVPENCSSVEDVDAEHNPAVVPGPPPDAAALPPPVRPAARPHRWGIGAYLVVVTTYVAVGLLLLLVFRNGGPSVGKIATVLVVPTVCAAGLAVLITRWRGNGPRVDLRLHWTWRGLGWGALFGFGGLFITLPASALYLSIVGPEANSAVGAAFGDIRASWAWAVAIFLCVVLVAPVCEEIVYRGLLWGALDWRWGRWVAFAVTTVLFAVAHLELMRTPLLLIVAIPLGLARLYTGSLVASIAAHSVTNLLPGIVIVLTLVGRLPTV
jgi:membrane protease YdiL (CAAX protease family)